MWSCYGIDDLDFTSFADDHTPHMIFFFLDRLKEALIKHLTGSQKSFLKAIINKCHLITSSKTPVEIEVSHIIAISEEKFWESI